MIIEKKTEWLSLFHENMIYEDMVKAVADIKLGLLAVEAEWHSDLQVELFEEKGSNGNDVWGFNLYPDKTIQYNSLINLKPSLNHKSMDIDDPDLQDKIKGVVDLWLI